MKIKTVELINFRAAENLKVSLHDQVNLIIGINGSGKSTILQAIAFSMLPLVRKIQNSRTQKQEIQVSDIRTGCERTTISIDTEYGERRYSWEISKVPPGYEGVKGNNHELDVLSQAIKSGFKEAEILPVIVYYPVGRVVEKQIPVMSRENNDIEVLDVYDNALEGRANFHNFFRWFREQDDLRNQKSLSRTHWMEQHFVRNSRRIEAILNKFESTLTVQERDALHFQKDKFLTDRLFLEEPRFLFREILELLKFNEQRSDLTQELYPIIQELDYMFHKMEKLSLENRDTVIDSKGNLLEILSKVLMLMSRIRNKRGTIPVEFDFLWNLFVFALELGLWWVSDESHRLIERTLIHLDWPKDENNLFEVNYEEADLINRVSETISNIINRDIQKRKTANRNDGAEITHVKSAIEAFIPEYSNLRINRINRGMAQMLVSKDRQEFDLGQLSDGEKNLIALVGDIARRLAIGNPQSKEPLTGHGIVLIDELELHLHPAWQRLVTQRLQTVFPNCQFIISTHSPQVISHIKSDCIIALANKNGNIESVPVGDSFGKNSDRILEDIMDVDARPHEINSELQKLFRLIQEGKIDEAKTLVSQIRNSIGEDSELIKANVLIKRMEIIGK